MNSFTFLHPWGFLSLSGLAVVGLIYLFYQRYRPLRITGLFLWGTPALTHRGGRKLERPRFSRSLFLDLLAALLLALAIAGPALTRNMGITHAIILDGSLSMRALENDDKARTAAIELLENLSGDEHALVLAAGSEPVILADAESLPGVAKNAISAYEPYWENDSIGAAIHLARQLVSGSMRITVLTDHELNIAPPPDSELHIHSFAANRGNVAILSATRQPSPDGEDLNLSIGNLANDSQEVGLTLKTGKETIYSDTFSLAADGIRHISLNPGTLPGDAIDINLSADNDALPDDSRATILSEPQRAVTFNISLNDRSIRDAAARALRAAGASYDSGYSDLLITESTDQKDHAPVTLILPPSNKKAEKIYTGPFVIDHLHPLCTDLELSGIYWPHVPVENIAGFDEVLVSAGEQGLLWQGESGFILEAGITSSNILRSSFWPVLMANLVGITRENLPGPVRTNYRSGERLRYINGADDPEFILSPDGRLPLPERLDTFILPRKPGIYELQTADGELLHKISINALSTSESDLRSLSQSDSEEITGENSGGRSPRVTASLAGLAALAALFLLLLNWYLDRL